MTDAIDNGRRAALGLLAATPLMLGAGTVGGGAQPAGPWTGGGTIACGGGTLRYATIGEGDGPPLVLLHKLGGWIADWRHVAPMLARGRQIVLFDMPGHGNSRMYGPAPYIMTMAEIVAMLLAAFDELGLDRVSIAGNSMGGIAGILIAALWPQRVESLTLISVSMIGAMSRADLRKQDVSKAAEAKIVAGRRVPTAEELTLFATTDPRVTQEQALGRAQAGDWMRPCERGVGRVGVTDYLPRVAVPTLLINSDRGRYARYAEIGKQLIPDARSVVISGAGSFLHQERPAEVARAMLEFLER